MSDIETGRLQIPQFQRDFVWDMRKSAKLLDSILKGYPVGTFIIWHTNKRLRSIRSIGGLNLPEPNMDDYVDYVLDGQQRITSLFVALKGEKIKRSDGKEDDFSKIIVDLDSEEGDQVVITINDKMDGHTYISLKDLYNESFAILTKYDKKYYEKLDEYRKNIHSYNYSVIEVTNSPIETATEIFTRTNVGGVNLTLFEIMVAITFDHDKKFDLAKKFDELVDELEETQYETIPDSAILQLISLMLRNECKRKTILSLPKDEIISVWSEMVDAIKHAIDYLRGHYQIPASNLLPYKTLIVPLAYFFYKYKNKPDANRQKYLDDFFWRVSLSGRYSSAVESKLAQDKRRIDSILEGNLPKYDWPIDTSPEFIKQNGWFSVGRSYVKAILCIYASYKPKSFDNGDMVIINNSWLKRINSKNYHHFFPKAYLKRTKTSEDIDHILNITIVDEYLNKREIRDQAPSKYMKKFKKHNQHLSETMKSHLIDNIDKFGIWSNNYKKFLDMRAIAVSEAIQSRIIEQENDKKLQYLPYDDSEEYEAEAIAKRVGAMLQY